MVLTPVPSLDELAAHPERALELPRKAAADLLVRAVTVQGVLLGRILDQPAGNGGPPEEPDGNRLLTVEEAAHLLGVTPVWLYRHSRSLPFARRLSRKCLRFSEAGLRKWQAAKRA